MPAGTGRARYRRILRFAARHLAATWWWEIFLPRIGLSRLSERTRTRRMKRIARRFHDLALDLGGLMIKVGQYMSSRLDVLPPEITKELEGLQDEVPAVPFPAVRTLAEAELGRTLASAYASFNETPIASASLGQAYRARLTPELAEEAGFEDVVVKIQRPGIDTIVEVDLAALRRVGGWLSHIRLVYTRVDMPALVEEFAATSLEEIDYLHEAASSQRFAEVFNGDARVGVPGIAWERSTRRVLTLQDVTAIKITDVESLRAAGIEPSEVAEVFATVMFDQVFTDGWFHADPHPGNIFVTPLPDGTGGEGRAWKLTFIDFGMMGQVPPTLRAGLRKLLISAATRDGSGLVDAIRDVGMLLPSADTVELERAMTALFGRFGGMGFAELREVDPREFRDFAKQFNDVVRSLPFMLPENLLLVIRAMSLTSGVCSALDPQFNLWDSVEPYARQLLRDERGNAVQDVARQALDIVTTAATLPKRLDGLITRIEDGDLAVTAPRLERRVASLDKTLRRIGSSLVFAGLIVAGAIVRPDDTVLGTVLMVASVIPLLGVVFGGRRGA
ncbi:ABC1 kinase family protein [Amnibacterium flavum]|uniref:ABC transporter n=1 Tax=Amnibacterium flavum TaxID=2173173 RepID=A0A2V1HQD1_9MICO|nr:AarF/UbiB family protein [Amnibacterium flavum]PVZ94551.1 ABC transporter [Amnibacterium flavum]